MYVRFLFNIGECIYLVSYWGYKKYIPHFTSPCDFKVTHFSGCQWDNKSGAVVPASVWQLSWQTSSFEYIACRNGSLRCMIRMALLTPESPQTTKR